MPSPFESAFQSIIAELDEQEKRQDAVLVHHRELIRVCAKTIKALHNREAAQAAAGLAQLDEMKAKLDVIKPGFEHIAEAAYQEYVEAKSLAALLDKRDPPTFSELGVPWESWLSGLADCVGELRRQLQDALRAGRDDDAQYLFGRMEMLFDQLTTIKYSGSLVGPLKRKQDMVRGQLEQARGELLRCLR